MFGEFTSNDLFEYLEEGLRSSSISRRMSSENALRSLTELERSLREISMGSEIDPLLSSGIGLGEISMGSEIDFGYLEKAFNIEEEERVDDERFILKQKLGQGNFGEVYLALDTAQGKLVALKLYIPSGFNDYKQEKVAYSILSETPNCDPYVVCMYDSGIFKSNYFISQELMSGSVVDFTGEEGKEIEYKIKNPLSLLLMFLQMAEGLRHIHESGMAHLDIKPQNILYKTYFSPLLVNEAFFNDPDNIRYSVCFKFGDPGFACTTRGEKFRKHKILDKEGLIEFPSCGGGENYRKSGDVPSLSNVNLCRITGTPLFMAPEFYSIFYDENTIEIGQDKKIEFYQANDVWSLGSTFLTIINGWNSIYELSNASNFGEKLEIKLNLGDPYLSHEIKDLIDGMLFRDYDLRLDATMVVTRINELVNRYFRSLPPSSSLPVMNPSFNLDDVSKLLLGESTRTQGLSTSKRNGGRADKRRRVVSGLVEESNPVPVRGQSIRTALSNRNLDSTNPILEDDYEESSGLSDDDINVYL